MQENNTNMKIINRAGLSHLIGLMENGFVPTIASAKVANAIMNLGFRCWNPATGENWY